ncbi:MAG: mRNA surveillance protein pelota [Desulfurococcaceae archaeon]|nr:mRNA surveillance protein pelota [Desulfurococcaceae archaeon]
MQRLRILREDLKHGVVELRVECEDDLWVLKGVIARGDVVVARTLRDVKIDGEGKRRLPMTLAIRVSDVYFQPFSGRLRVHGQIVEGPDEYGLRGSYHTLSIDVGSELVIVKSRWTRELLNRLRRASSRRVKVLLVSLDFDEVAIAVALDQGIRFVVERTLPGLKDEGPGAEDLAREVVELIVLVASREEPDMVIVASPSFLKDLVVENLRRRLGKPIYIDSVSEGGRAGVYEVIRRDTFRKVLQYHNIAIVEEIFDEFMRLLSTDSDRVAYGLQQVRVAAREGAVSKLLVCEDQLYGSEREEVEELMERVEEIGGEVRIVPEESPAFAKVKAFGGILAILRYGISYWDKTRETDVESPTNSSQGS